MEEYQAICQDNGFERPEDKLQLSGYLHDLGVCLHFQDDPLLRKTVILKPQWATDAVYKLLDHETVVSNMGRFNDADLPAIWCEARYEDSVAELLQLMKRFRLCYRIPDTSSYIAPQLLTLDQPDYQWDDEYNLIVRYTYEFMPKGMVTQFIVSMHRYILEQNYVWRSGVVLDKDGTRAEVIENYKKREIKDSRRRQGQTRSDDHYGIRDGPYSCLVSEN